jgi:hypothetical protein
MRTLDENTVSLYINPFLAVCMYQVMLYNDLNLDVFKNLPLTDWALIVFFSVGVVGAQTLRFMAF